jgi:hypothetical protein
MSLEEELKRVFDESEKRSLDSIADEASEAERLGRTIRASDDALFDCLTFLARRVEALERAVNK